MNRLELTPGWRVLTGKAISQSFWIQSSSCSRSAANMKIFSVVSTRKGPVSLGQPSISTSVTRIQSDRRITWGSTRLSEALFFLGQVWESQSSTYLLVFLLFAQIPLVLLHTTAIFALKKFQSGDGAGALLVKDAPHTFPPLYIHAHTFTHTITITQIVNFIYAVLMMNFAATSWHWGWTRWLTSEKKNALFDKN